jgi:hypothetical protein
MVYSSAVPDSSTPAVNGVWQAFAAKYDLNLDELLTS